MPRTARRSGAALAQIMFDDTVLERVEGDYDQPSFGPEYSRGRLEPARELAELVVDVNTKRLECPRRGMDGQSRRRRPHRLRDHTRELAGPLDRTRGDDSACDAARPALFTVLRNHARQR